MTTDDGGPAFPLPVPHYATAEDTGGGLGDPGMTYRQWLAGLAMQGLLAEGAREAYCEFARRDFPQMSASEHSKMAGECLALAATGLADALIAALRKDSDQ